MNLDNLYQMCESVENVRLIVTPSRCGTMNGKVEIKYYLHCPFCRQGRIATENHENFRHKHDCTVEKAKIATEQIKEFVLSLADDLPLYEQALKPEKKAEQPEKKEGFRFDLRDGCFGPDFSGF